eukprot:gene10660-11823_t
MVTKTYQTYQKLAKLPFGKFIFSKFYSYFAPYFRTVNASVLDMKPGYAAITMKQRWSVQNHIKTIHAIAVCNLAEMTMGLIAESTIPDHLRWLPMGMDVDYLKKASGQLTATSKVDPETFFNLPSYPGQVKVPIEVHNAEGVLVTKADIRLWISVKPEKKGSNA